MSGSAPFRLNRSGLLLALISAGFAAEAGAAAARVDFATEGVTVAGRDGQARPLRKGGDLDAGDTVRTSAAGRAQLRFNDGSYVSLQPNTDFAINEYKYEGKDDDRGFFGLVRGAMRTVTGAVGRVNRNSYRITTPTATVGIRGTGGVIQVLNDGSTLVIGTSGIWSLTNPSGSIDIPAGVSGLAPRENNTPPRETNTQPQTKPADVPPPKNPDYKKGEETTEDGTSKDVADAVQEPSAPTTPPLNYIPLVSGSGYQVSAVGVDASGAPQHFFVGGQNATFNSTGQLTAFGTTNIGTGTHADFNSDGILAWGRWTGNIVVNGSGVSLNSNQGYHYVVGILTATLPATGTATYSLIGATSPTYMSGNPGPGTVTGGTVVASFGTPLSGFNNISVNGLTVAMPDRTYTTNASALCVSGSAFTMSGIGLTTGCAIGSSCNTTIKGFFSGASAQRVGIGFSVSDGAQTMMGAAAFK